MTSNKAIIRFYLLWCLLVLGFSWLKLTFNHPLVNIALWFSVILLVSYFARAFKKSFRDSIKWKTPRIKSLIITLLLGILTLIIYLGYFKILGMTHFPVPSTHQNLQDYSWPWWTSFLLIAILPVILEEISFRALILGELCARYPFWMANLIQASLYALLHLRPLMIASHLLLGLYFGYISKKTNSIYLGTLLHILLNTWALLMAGKAMP